MPTLERLLSHLTVDVEPFAECTLTRGWRLWLPAPPDAMLHFVLEGTGVLRGAHNLAYPIHPFSLAVVPHSSPHALECGISITSERVIDVVPEGEGTHQLARRS